jgi:hypothetical protein
MSAVSPHLWTAAVDKRLRRIRGNNPRAGILIVTETLFSMGSDGPDVAALQTLCRRYDATLPVDCAHDLGALGERRFGILHAQGMVGKVDVLMVRSRRPPPRRKASSTTMQRNHEIDECRRGVTGMRATDMGAAVSLISTRAPPAKIYGVASADGTAQSLTGLYHLLAHHL